MSILLDKNTKVLVQGITGKTASFHTELCQQYGTRIVAGVSPGKGRTRHLNVPVFETVAAAKTHAPIDASLIFVPAASAYEAISEALEAAVALIVVITEGIPVHDMLKVKRKLNHGSSILIGPNCPGILTPAQAKMGIIPGLLGQPGSIGVVSRSGTLTYEAAHQINRAGLGTSTIAGIGGDPIIGTDFVKILELFDADPQTSAVLLIGEIGGRMEQDAALYWSQKLQRRKPLFAFIAGQTAPKGKRMGHAGAIMEGTGDSAAAKNEFLAGQGVVIVPELGSIGPVLKARIRAAATA